MQDLSGSLDPIVGGFKVCCALADALLEQVSRYAQFLQGLPMGRDLVLKASVGMLEFLRARDSEGLGISGKIITR